MIDTMADMKLILLSLFQIKKIAFYALKAATDYLDPSSAV